MFSFGILSEVWCTGGVERQVIALLRHLPPHIQCVGIGLSPGAPTDMATVLETGKLCPVYGTKRFSETGRDSYVGVKRFDTYAEVEQQFGNTDALLVWSKTRIPEWYRGRVIAVSHGCVDWTKRTLAELDDRITDCVAVSRLASNSFPLHRQPEVTVIRNGIEWDRLTPVESWRDARFSRGIREDCTVVAYVGRFSDEKEPLAAARAVRHLVDNKDDAIALYCGIGFDHGETRKQIEDITRGYCVFLPVDDVATAYTIADCVVCCSPQEGFGLTRVEAMATGVPLVCTRTGIIPEIEEQIGECAEIVRNPKSEAEMAWAVIQAVANPQRAAKARAYVWTEFSARKMAHEWTQYLERIGGEVQRATELESRSCVSRSGN